MVKYISRPHSHECIDGLKTNNLHKLPCLRFAGLHKAVPGKSKPSSVCLYNPPSSIRQEQTLEGSRNILESCKVQE